MSEPRPPAAAVYSYSGWYDGAYQHAAIERCMTLENPKKLPLGSWKPDDLLRQAD